MILDVPAESVTGERRDAWRHPALRLSLRRTFPRTTAAQSMDVLISQSAVAGYRAVIVAANALPKDFPLAMAICRRLSPYSPAALFRQPPRRNKPRCRPPGGRSWFATRYFCGSKFPGRQGFPENRNLLLERF